MSDETVAGRDRSGDLDWIAIWLEEIAAVQGIPDPRLHDTDGPDGDCLDDCGGCRSYEAVRQFAERVWDRGYERREYLNPFRTTHGDPFLSPRQTNPTAGTPEDAAAQLDMAGDLTFNRDDEGEV